MIVVSPFGASPTIGTGAPASTGTPIFPSSVNPFNVYFQDPDAYQNWLNGYTPTGNLATTMQSAGFSGGGQLWPPADPSQISLLTTLLTKAANKADQSGPLATAAQQLASALQDDAKEVDYYQTQWDGLFVSDGPYSPLTGTPKNTLEFQSIAETYWSGLQAAVTKIDQDILSGTLNLMQASSQDTGGSVRPMKATVPLNSQVVAANAVLKSLPTIPNNPNWDLNVNSSQIPTLTGILQPGSTNVIGGASTDETLPGSSTTSAWPWIVGGIGLVGILAFIGTLAKKSPV
jgi:hypothetical protein